MVSLSSLAKTLLLNHISRFHSSRSPIGRPRSLSFSYILDRILFLLSSGCQWSRLPVSHGSWKSIDMGHRVFIIQGKENFQCQ